MKIVAIPILEDNYVWVIHDDRHAIIVDPGEYEPVDNILTSHELQPLAILITHKHADHTDGVMTMKERYPKIHTYGPLEVSDLVDTIVNDGDSFEIQGQSFEVIKTAGHSVDHISYYMNESDLFCGDALFMGGCGRVFTQDYEAQYRTLQQLSHLPDATRIYAGHEYTIKNLQFALSIEPDNDDIKMALDKAENAQDSYTPTLPSTMELEKRINLFIKASDVEEFKKLRKLRDQF